MSSQIFYGTMAVLIAAVAISESRQDVSQLQQENNLAAKSTREDQKPNRVDDTRLYMRAKLASSQRVMEGLLLKTMT